MGGGHSGLKGSSKEVKKWTNLGEALKTIEKDIYQKDKEEAHVLNDNGEYVIPHVDGGKSSVNFTKEQETLMPNATLIHNHPDGSSFSAADINYLADKELRTIIASAITGIRYTLTRKTNDMNKVKAFASAFTKFDDEVKTKAYLKAKAENDSGKISDSQIYGRVIELWSKYCDTWLKNNASKYDCEFKRGKIK